MDDLAKITRCYSMHFERRIAHSADRLWQAITEPGEVSAWMDFPAQIEPRVGGQYHVDFSKHEEGAIDGVIVRLEPGRRLAYVWGASVVEWTLEPDGEGCRYTFAHHGQPPGLVSDDAGIAAGWHAWLDDLDTYLGGGRPVDGEARMKALMERYRAPVAQALDG